MRDEFAVMRVNGVRYVQVLEQLKLEPEAAMLTNDLIKKAGAVHTIVPAGHHIGTPQVLHFCTAH